MTEKERRPEPTTMSFRKFADEPDIGCCESAVRRAVKTGRLERSIGRDRRGRRVIIDVALAKEEWQANRDPSMGPWA
jgi:hypothetical protein